MQSDAPRDPATLEARVACPTGFALTGCSCYSSHGNCAGARPEGDTCVAQLVPPVWFFGAGGRAQAACLYKGEPATLAGAGGAAAAAAACSAPAAIAARLGNHEWMDTAVSDKIAAIEAGYGGAAGLIFFAGMCCCGLSMLLGNCALRLYRRKQLRRLQVSDGARSDLGAPPRAGVPVSSSSMAPMLSAQALPGTGSV